MESSPSCVDLRLGRAALPILWRCVVERLPGESAVRLGTSRRDGVEYPEDWNLHNGFDDRLDARSLARLETAEDECRRLFCDLEPGARVSLECDVATGRVTGPGPAAIEIARAMVAEFYPRGAQLERILTEREAAGRDRGASIDIPDPIGSPRDREE